MADFRTLKVTHADGVLTIAFNRPDVLNSFSEQMSIEFGAALRSAERDRQVRCLVITGAGRAFCAGQDLDELRAQYAHASQGAMPDLGHHLRRMYHPIVQRLHQLEKPVIAAINGPAVGAGAGFALACDLKYAARSAYLMMAFVKVGLIPDAGAALTVLQHAGYARAAELFYLGEKLPAEQAAEWGLVNKVFDDDALRDEVQAIAAKLAQAPTRALGLTKRSIQRAWTMNLEQQLELEAFLQQTAGRTKDHQEGIAAFLEKRSPGFTGE